MERSCSHPLNQGANTLSVVVGWDDVSLHDSRWDAAWSTQYCEVFVPKVLNLNLTKLSSLIPHLEEIEEIEEKLSNPIQK